MKKWIYLVLVLFIPACSCSVNVNHDDELELEKEDLPIFRMDKNMIIKTNTGNCYEVVYGYISHNNHGYKISGTSMINCRYYDAQQEKSNEKKTDVIDDIVIR